MDKEKVERCFNKFIEDKILIVNIPNIKDLVIWVELNRDTNIINIDSQSLDINPIKPLASININTKVVSIETTNVTEYSKLRYLLPFINRLLNYE